MAKQNKSKMTLDHQPPTRLVRFMGSDTFRETLAKFAANAQVLQALRNFIDFKRQNPLQQAGGKDRPFVGNGPLGGYIHAGLTRDISIIYTVSGRDPHVIKLFGLYSHNDIGTGTPGRPHTSKIMANTWSKQTAFRPVDPVDESQKHPTQLPLLVELLELIP